jgi:hypothetical protein
VLRDYEHASALVDGDDAIVAEQVGNGGTQLGEVAAARVGLVACHELGDLAIGQGAGARIGKQVERDLVGGHQRRIPASRGEQAPPLGAIDRRQGRDDLGLERLHRGQVSTPAPVSRPPSLSERTSARTRTWP